jgi:hypothetical protein
MSVPIGIPLVGGASPWVVFGPVAALSVAAGWVVAEIDRRLPRARSHGGVAELPAKEPVRTAA